MVDMIPRPVGLPHPEWWQVTTAEDLAEIARRLAALSDLFVDERRRHTYPKARDLIDNDRELVASWAQEAMTARDRGDGLDRRDALALALGRYDAAVVRLRRWTEAGDLWNEHRIMPRPAPSGGVR